MQLAVQAVRHEVSATLSRHAQRRFGGGQAHAAVKLLVDRGRSVQMNEDVAVQRVRAEFEEMPDLTLTVPQASRLFGIEKDLCRTVVEKLIDSAYLRWTRLGAVTRGSR